MPHPTNKYDLPNSDSTIKTKIYPTFDLITGIEIDPNTTCAHNTHIERKLNQTKINITRDRLAGSKNYQNWTNKYKQL